MKNCLDVIRENNFVIRAETTFTAIVFQQRIITLVNLYVSRQDLGYGMFSSIFNLKMMAFIL